MNIRNLNNIKNRFGLFAITGQRTNRDDLRVNIDIRWGLVQPIDEIETTHPEHELLRGAGVGLVRRSSLNGPFSANLRIGVARSDYENNKPVFLVYGMDFDGIRAEDLPFIKACNPFLKTLGWSTEFDAFCGLVRKHLRVHRMIHVKDAEGFHYNGYEGLPMTLNEFRGELRRCLNEYEIGREFLADLDLTKAPEPATLSA